MTLLLWLILAPFTLLTLSFAVELFAGVRPLAVGGGVSSAATAVVIVPAHNEESILADSLAALKQATAGRAKILVVADNCSDSTAKVARRLGVNVVERVDPQRRGKSYALDFARSCMRSAPPEVVVIIDADCVTDPESIERLVEKCAVTGKPCQAVYLQTAAPDAPPMLQLSTFAFFVKNLIRQRALQRLAGRVHLLGTGMALPWRLFESADLATGNIVEDLEMGLELTDAGYSALLLEDAAVWSKPASVSDTLNQRRRWEGGYLESAAKWAPRMFLQNLARGNVRGLWSAVNLLIPPFTLLVLLDLGAVLLSIIPAWVAGVSLWPSSFLAGSMLLVVVGLIAAVSHGGSRFISLRGLALVPVYLLWKLPLYLGLARRGAPKEWMRTRRG